MRRKFGKIISGVLLFLMIAVAILPLIVTFTGSFMSQNEVVNRYTEAITEENRDDPHTDTLHFVKLSLLPSKVSLEQYRNLLFRDPRYLRMFWNSILLVVPILVGQLLIAPLAAFGFEQLRFKYKEAIFFIYMIVMLMPLQILLVPHFLVAGWLGIKDSYLAIILPAMFHPLGVFLIRQQIKGFPSECLEAARLDGAGEFQIYRKIMRPNMTGIVAAMIVLLFTDNWNIVDQAVVFIRDAYREPMSVYLNRILGDDPGMFFAASAFYALPALLVFFTGKEYLIEGISMSGIKS